MYREEHRFPTRNYPYREVLPEELATWALVAEPPLEAGRVHRLIMGVDAPPPRSMSPLEVEELLRDSFAELLLKRGNFPLSLRALLNTFDVVNDDPSELPRQASYIVADGGRSLGRPKQLLSIAGSGS